jgi:hypothetical protein
MAENEEPAFPERQVLNDRRPLIDLSSYARRVFYFGFVALGVRTRRSFSVRGTSGRPLHEARREP